MKYLCYFLFIIAMIVLILSSTIVPYLILKEYKNNLDKKIKDQNKLTNDLESSVAMLNLCKSLVTIEVNRVISTHQRLNNKYNMMKFDDDVRSIAEKVFNGIKNDRIDSDDLVIDPEYLMSYIIDETTMQLLMNTAEWNTKINLYQ